MTRLLVGTLYTNENEFEDCIRTICAQTYRHFDHQVFQNLPNREAHATLFQTFLTRAADHDALVKVDADMVLARTTLFAEVVDKLRANPWAQVVSIAVHDFFSDQLIWGLNAYRNTVMWDFDKQTLFVDRPELPKSAYLMDDTDLAPAAYHCKNPSPLQALHYGVHRGLKALQPGTMEKIEQSSKTHWNTMERTWERFCSTGDTRLGLACVGAELAYRRRFTPADLDYSSERLKEAVDHYSRMDARGLGRTVRSLRLGNLGFLPGTRRRQLLRVLYA